MTNVHNVDSSILGLDDNNDDGQTIPEYLILTTFDLPNSVTYVEKTAASISDFIKTAHQVFSNLENTIHIPNVKWVTLQFIVQFMHHHKGVEPVKITKPIKSHHMIDMVADPWDAIFIDNIGSDVQTLFELLQAANYLCIDCLMQLVAAKIACLIKDKSVHEINDLLSRRVESEPRHIALPKI
jgi:hypothetical protein